MTRINRVAIAGDHWSAGESSACARAGQHLALASEAPHPSDLSGSPRLDVGGPDHLAPNFNFDLNLLGHVLRRACHRLEAERRQAFLDLRKRDASHDLSIQRGDDVFRRSGRYEETDPLIGLDV